MSDQKALPVTFPAGIELPVKVEGIAKVNVENSPTVHLAPGTTVKVEGAEIAPAIIVKSGPGLEEAKVENHRLLVAAEISNEPTIKIGGEPTVKISGIPEVKINGEPKVKVTELPNLVGGRLKTSNRWCKENKEEKELEKKFVSTPLTGGLFLPENIIQFLKETELKEKEIVWGFLELKDEVEATSRFRAVVPIGPIEVPETAKYGVNPFNLTATFALGVTTSAVCIKGSKTLQLIAPMPEMFFKKIEAIIKMFRNNTEWVNAEIRETKMSYRVMEE